MTVVVASRIEPASTAAQPLVEYIGGHTINGEATVTIGHPDDRPKCQTLGDAAGQLGFRGRGKIGRKALRNLARGR